MLNVTLDGNQTLVMAIIAYFLGRFLTGRISFLDTFRIPEAVTGGLVVATGVTILRSWFSIEISFSYGDLAMLAFFTTIGLNARFSDLTRGGITLLITLGVCVAAVLAENLVGLFYAKLFGAPPAAGIMAGSVALIGGHGTAAAWAPVFQEAAPAANTIGLASATFGLVAGGLAGGPLGRYLITKNNLKPAENTQTALSLSDEEERKGKIDVPQFFASILVIAISIAIGSYLNIGLAHLGVKLPQFVTSLFAGIVIGNLGPRALPRISWPNHSSAMRLIAELALSIFLVRALMSLELWTLAAVAGKLLTVMLSQVVLVLLLARFLLFPLLHRSYDGAIISAGFIGLSLGATPTAVANMDSLSHKYGPSPTAFLVIPLVGAFFIDLVNAFVISTFYGMFGG